MHIYILDVHDEAAKTHGLYIERDNSTSKFDVGQNLVESPVCESRVSGAVSSQVPH